MFIFRRNRKKRTLIQSQTLSKRRQMLLSAAYGGIVDGLYLYIGVLGLCSLAPPVFTAMAIFCSIYFLACIATRVYEEYDFQRRLVITQAKIDLALCGKTLETQINELNDLWLMIAEQGSTPDRITKQQELTDMIGHLHGQFEKKRAYLRELSTLSYSSALLAGMKNGLAAYGALASAMFAIATVIVLASASFPPTLLIACITMGMGLLIGFTIHAIVHAYRHQVKQEQELDNNPHDEKLNEILHVLKTTKQQVGELKPEKVKTAISDGMIVDPSPQFFFQEWFEVVRSFFSGLGKGSKAVDFTMNNFQERDDMGHYHDTPIMLGVTVVSAVVHAIALALRAQARAFGRNPIDSIPNAKIGSTKESIPTPLSGGLDPASQRRSDSPGMNSPSVANDINIDIPIITSPTTNTRISPFHTSSGYSLFSFFSSSKEGQQKSRSEGMVRSQSAQDLSEMENKNTAPPVPPTMPSPSTQYW